MHRLVSVFNVVLMAFVFNAARPAGQTNERLGSVSSPISCTADLQKPFERAAETIQRGQELIEQAQKVEAEREVEPFEFHSNFWINLHHFLYMQALPLPPGRLASHLPAMPASEQKSWEQAVAFYREHMVKLDFVDDEQMARIDSYLAKMENTSAIGGEVIGNDVATVLTSAAPVYKQYWWPRQDIANQFWIGMVQPLLASLGDQMRKQLVTAYEAEWPAKLIRVDVSVYANWGGAYTNVEPGGQVHTVMSSVDSGNQGFAAIETLFHEASHGIVDGETGKLGEAIQTQAKAQGIPVPDNLWHALIFYTVGEFVRRDLDRVGVHDYQPYADKQGLWARSWPTYRPALALFWQAHMDGRLSLNDAVSEIMKALAVIEGKHN
jgi:hypothetical protein